jgi:dihydrolipoamide dehydrogenase
MFMVMVAAAAITFSATTEGIALTCHTHPTFTEAVKEAALAVDNRTLSI